MSTVRVIVSETSGRWSFALRTALLGSRVTLTEVAGLIDAFGQFHGDSQALMAFEATEAVAEEGMRQLQWSRYLSPGRGVIVLLDDSLAASESFWREAGAIAVVASPRQLWPVARLIRRYFDTRQPPIRTFREDRWQRMPWRGTELQSLEFDREK